MRRPPIRQAGGAMTRRALLRGSALAGAGLATGLLPRRAFAQQTAPAIVTSERALPQLPYGVQAGDLAGDRAIIWAAADRPARMRIEWATGDSFADARSVIGPAALEDTGFTAKFDLGGLPPGQQIVYRVRMVDLADASLVSEPVEGSFRTPPAARRPIRFLWSGDVAGQGWGINPDWGGMRIFETMRRLEPDFFIHSGDTIYADDPIAAEQAMPDGGVWKNVTTEAKAKVAETLAEFRGNFAYNLLDDNLRRFAAQVPMLVQWDDHDVSDNWYPRESFAGDPGKAAYTVTSAALLGARAARAFQEWMPVRWDRTAWPHLYRRFAYGPSLEIFRIDMRSYRGPNTDGRETALSGAARILGAAQLSWLKRALLASSATWKVIAADMPIGLVVWDDFRARRGADAVAQGDDGPPLGRELEFADLLRFIRDSEIRNVVWLTADVHYTAAHYYDPNQARFQEFAPFWEFVSGPLNAGTFGPGELDPTFGPQLAFAKAPPAGQFNLPPSAGLQFFGQVDIDADEVMTVTLKDLAGAALFSRTLEPERDGAAAPR
ncbi:MAG TPA: alkaline phosphatase D family protein [Geminicoccaceae bacterium]|nr:alkaline phosphatase D family protein [Geminicoccaceae bacterium]